MFARMPLAKQYSAIGVESKVLAANPHRLITLLFDGAIEALTQAAEHHRAGRVAEKQRVARKAVAIVVEGLRACLNTDHGGDIAVSLKALYDYIAGRIFEAARTGDERGFAEAIRLLGELRATWNEIDPDRHAAGEASAPPLAGSALTKAFALA